MVDFEQVNASWDYATNQNSKNRDLILKTGQKLQMKMRRAFTFGHFKFRGLLFNYYYIFIPYL